MSQTLHMFAVRVTTAGALGAAYMVLYKAALRRVDFDLIPVSALRRVRWWSTHATVVLAVSLTLTVLGLVLSTAT
ncbi:hypothetical protein [Streptomyces sp. NPDC005799]|uniref:hypothetical protein n=1 Tax=Streptomyces sp. NPDC005799 TaxID=3154678 RepID=UPI0033FD059F